MIDDIYRLVYYSRNAVIGNPQVLDAAIASILATSRITNAQVDITGALMFNTGCFAQVLEGAQASVEDVFERIQQDERHSDVSLLAFDRVPSRRFAQWSMGYVGTSQHDAVRFGLLARNSGFDPANMSGEKMLEMLLRLAIEEEHPPH